MINLTKKYRTRNGKEVVALFSYPDNPPDYRIVAHVNIGNQVVVIYYDECGSYLSSREEDCRDLVEVKSQEDEAKELAKDVVLDWYHTLGTRAMPSLEDTIARGFLKLLRQSENK